LGEWSHEETTQVFPEVIEHAVRMISEAGSQHDSSSGRDHVDRGKERLHVRQRISSIDVG
jgi:hypothetical protein